MARIFLRAEWRNLVMVSYHVPAKLLEPRLPPGLELDPIDGAPTASLVAFQFLNTRVMGVPWPGFVNFPEWNLRFYVRTREATPHPPRRGVVFIREFVPSRFVSRMARMVYNEPYTGAPFTQDVRVEHQRAAARYTVRFGGRDHTLDAAASGELEMPPESSLPHLLKEHQWGFGTTRGGKTLCYEVVHPRWRTFRDATCRVDVDWARLYGPEWGVMQGATPFSSILAEGSAISVATAMTLESSAPAAKGG